MQSGKPAAEDDWVHPIGNDGSVACGVFLLLARRHVPGDVHPTCDLAMGALHMLWASVDDASPVEEARQSFQRLATAGAVRLTNVQERVTVPARVRTRSPFQKLKSICHGPRANVIVRVDTEGLTGVTVIGDNFLSDCTSLRVVNLRGLVNVTRIGDCFMSDCHTLQAGDLAPLSRIKAIGECFMVGCESLTALDVSPLSRLTTLPNGFLCGCKSLQSLECRPLRSVTTIGADFLTHCAALQELNVSSFASVTQIGNCFLTGCAALQELNVSSFASVTQIGECFLATCPALRTLDLSAMTEVDILSDVGLLHDHQLQSLIRPETGEFATAAVGGL